MKNPKLGQNRPKAGANPPHLDGLCDALWARCRSRRARSERDVAHLVARDAGFSEDSVRNWLQGRCRPGALALLKMCLAYGPDFLAEAWPAAPAWLSSAARAEEQRRLEAEQAEISARLKALKAERAGDGGN